MIQLSKLIKMQPQLKKKVNLKGLFSLLILILFASCTSKQDDVLNKAKKLSETNVEDALQLLDKNFRESKTPENKLVYLNAIEKIVKEKLKDSSHYKAVLEKKILYTNDLNLKNKNLLTLAQLLIQNFRKEDEALSVLSQIDLESLKHEDRDRYFQSVLISYINAKDDEQALIEANTYLKRNDLSPSENFKIRNLKSRSLVNLKRMKLAEEEYISLLQTYPNLSKKWNVRSQLGLLLEEQKEYKKAIFHLKKQMEENDKKDPLVEWRIAELSKRMKQQPGGKGRLRR